MSEVPAVNATTSPSEDIAPTPESSVLEQAAIQPEVDIKALQKSYSELQSAFTKKAQAYKELEQRLNAMPSREEVIREYLTARQQGAIPPVITSSSSAFDFAKEKKPTSLAQAERLAREFFKKGV